MARSSLQLELAFGASRHADWSEAELLDRLRRLGAGQLNRVVFRASRRRIWSVTRSARYGLALNLDPIFRSAPHDVVEAFAVVASRWRDGSSRLRDARKRVREWHRAHSPPPPPPRRVACAGTVEQRAFLRHAFNHLNRTRFDELLPTTTSLRFSDRMTRRLGQMREPHGGRVQETSGPPSGAAAGLDGDLEIALSLDLLVEGNEEAFLDTLLHEMAHAADFLTRGRTDHGPHWRMWAARVGCTPRRCATEPIERSRRGRRIAGVPLGHRRVQDWPA